MSISGYHIAEPGANPISQLPFTLSNGFSFVEAYLAQGEAHPGVLIGRGNRITAPRVSTTTTARAPDARTARASCAPAHDVGTSPPIP